MEVDVTNRALSKLSRNSFMMYENLLYDVSNSQVVFDRVTDNRLF
jgi:hypothetical protein